MGKRGKGAWPEDCGGWLEKVAVVGKFFQRNQRQEGQVEEILLARHPT